MRGIALERIFDFCKNICNGATGRILSGAEMRTL